MKTYLYVYLGSAFLALLATPVVIRLARRVGALDHGSVRGVHKQPMPRIGGVAIFFAAMCMITSVLFLDNRIGQTFQRVHLQLSTLLGVSVFVFLVGLIDDLRGLPAKIKLLVEIVAAGVLCHVGIEITALEITNGYVIHLGPLACPLTVLWIVGITNAVNLTDGLDGLAAGVSAVACAVIAIFAIYSQLSIMAVIMLALLGGLCGFLFYNFNPAKTFMGDCGSLFVGFMIASSSVMCMTKSSAMVGLALPILALGIPIFDTFFAMLRRFLERRSLFAPDRSHFHHKLIDLGLTQRHAVTFIYAATAGAAGLGLFMLVRRDTGAVVVFVCTLLLLALLFRVVGAVRFRATLLGLQVTYASARQRKREQRTFEDLQLSFRRVRNEGEWWSVVCDAARRMDFAWVSLTTTDSGGNMDTRIWRGTGEVPVDSPIVVMSLPLKDTRSEMHMEFDIAIVTNGSLESAGRRGALFGRLVDEYGPTHDVRYPGRMGEPTLSAKVSVPSVKSSVYVPGAGVSDNPQTTRGKAKSGC